MPTRCPATRARPRPTAGEIAVISERYGYKYPNSPVEGDRTDKASAADAYTRRARWRGARRHRVRGDTATGRLCTTIGEVAVISGGVATNARTVWSSGTQDPEPSFYGLATADREREHTTRPHTEGAGSRTSQGCRRRGVRGGPGLGTAQDSDDRAGLRERERRTAHTRGRSAVTATGRDRPPLPHFHRTRDPPQAGGRDRAGCRQRRGGRRASAHGRSAVTAADPGPVTVAAVPEDTEFSHRRGSRQGGIS
jgi:hypothetical protein